MLDVATAEKVSQKNRIAKTTGLPGWRPGIAPRRSHCPSCPQSPARIRLTRTWSEAVGPTGFDPTANPFEMRTGKQRERDRVIERLRKNRRTGSWCQHRGWPGRDGHRQHGGTGWRRHGQVQGAIGACLAEVL